jgi:hypothetical protein
MSIHHLRFNDLKGVQRGQDIVNYPVVHSKLGALNLKSGIDRMGRIRCSLVWYGSWRPLAHHFRGCISSLRYKRLSGRTLC